MTFLLIRTTGGWHDPEERSVIAEYDDREEAEDRMRRGNLRGDRLWVTEVQDWECRKCGEVETINEVGLCSACLAKTRMRNPGARL